MFLIQRKGVRFMNKDIKQPRGQALIIIALAMVGLVSFAALAIDGGMVFSDRRHSQNAADTSALAAALAKLRGQNFTAAALARAASNGYDNNGVSNIVQVNNPPISGTYAGNDEYIQVIITSYVKTTFARIVGRQQVMNVTEAIARAKPRKDEPMFSGAAMISLKTTGAGFTGTGNVNLEIKNSGLFVNSSSNCAMSTNGNGTFTVNGAYTVVGTACKSGNLTLNGPVQSGAQVPYPPSISIPAPDVTCSGNGSVSGNTVYPGNFATQFKIPGGNGSLTFAPGNYCFNNGAFINGNFDITANNVNFRINGGSFSINGNTTFTCNNMLVYGAGGTGMEFNGNGDNTCTGTTFYMQTGKVLWNGNAANKFKAKTDGVYKGLLIYMPYGNNNDLTINGNSGNELTGSIIAVSSPITLNGNSGTAGLHTQIIGYDITLNGNSNTVIDYDPAEQYTIVTDPAIEITR